MTFTLKFELVDLHVDNELVYLFTSGTTGLPKAARYSFSFNKLRFGYSEISITESLKCNYYILL